MQCMAKVCLRMSSLLDFNKLKARLASNDFDPGSKDKGICFDTLLHAADISNPFKPMKNYEKWTFRVLGEFWQ